MKKRNYFLVFLALLAFLTALTAGYNAEAASDPIVIKSACFLPATHSIGGIVPS
jgi:hypothetical protein